MTAPDPRVGEIEAIEAAADIIVQGDRGACECRRSPFDKHDVNPPCSTRRQALRVARAALEAAHPVLLAELRKAHEALTRVETMHTMEYIEDGDDSRNRCMECLYEADGIEDCPTVEALRAAVAAANGDGNG